MYVLYCFYTFCAFHRVHSSDRVRPDVGITTLGEGAEVEEGSEKMDQLPDKGLTPGCSTDGLGHEVATAEGSEGSMREKEEG